MYFSQEFHNGGYGDDGGNDDSGNDDGGNDDGCNGDDDGNGGDDNGDDDNDRDNGRDRSIEVKGKMKIILQVAQLDLGSLQWQLVIQKCFNEAIIYYI